MRFPGRGLSLEGEVELPDGAAVDADRADATVTQNGTLEVLIPKAPSEDDPEESVDAGSDDQNDDADQAE
jgi:hypothetical protein